MMAFESFYALLAWYAGLVFGRLVLMVIGLIGLNFGLGFSLWRLAW